jgi:hypothetical protein
MPLGILPAAAKAGLLNNPSIKSSCITSFLVISAIETIILKNAAARNVF